MMRRFAAAAALLLAACAGGPDPGALDRPNILWIIGEDASPHLGCYGETAIRTPHLDALAAEGIRFTRAFATCPVCSPSRSALFTGMYQTTLGAHNHRSQNIGVKASGNTAFYDSYRLPVPLVPELFRDAGYLVSLEGKLEPGGYARFGGNPDAPRLAKTDYNFLWDPTVYEATRWNAESNGRPFFAQIMLRAGQNRTAREHGTHPDAVKLPPYYPDIPALRKDWADYLNSWAQTDKEVGAILAELERSGHARNTVVFFFTDHGMTHARGIQFCYEDGSRIPLLVRFPDRRRWGTVRDDLVRHIDVAATSLTLAGIRLPTTMQGVNLFARDYEPRSSVVIARDRCDETVDIIRALRTPRFKYIRNFLSHIPHLQPNRFKDRTKFVRAMRPLHEEGKLTPLQARLFAPTRPVEELYDLEEDPGETVNLAERPEHAELLRRLRNELHAWMDSSGDLGLIPEPILEELGKKHGNKFRVMRQRENRGLVPRLISVIEAGERKDRVTLEESLKSPRPSLRYWAATGLGLSGEPSAVPLLVPRLKDPSAAVRIAAALALGRLGRTGVPEHLLARELENENLVAGMYAARALEWIGDGARNVRAEIRAARDSRYELTRRITRRLTDRLGP